MSYRVVWSLAAVRDLEALIDFVAERDGIGSAERLHTKVHRAIEGLAASPQRCRVIPELRALGLTVYRELVVKPYRVPFRIVGKEVVVLGVLDGRRDLEEVLLRRMTEP